MVVILDYGTGNLNSILNMLKKINLQPAMITSSKDDILEAEKLILPGVGSFDTGMSLLNNHGFVDVLNEKVLKQKIPALGICLGMQLMMEKSEEGKELGLSWIKGEVKRFKFSEKNSHLKIPHMGWNKIKVTRKSALTKEQAEEARFYFVHSYHVVCNDEKNILAYTNYGYDFASMIQHENIMGAQFHPEKSHKFGMRILKNFLEIS